MKPLELLRAIWTSCGFAARGIGFTFRTQRNFRIQLAAAGMVLTAGSALKFSRTEMAILLLTSSLVLMGELVNTAFEFLFNLMEARHHPTVRAVKDVVAGTVFLGALSSIGVGLILFGPRLLVLIQNR